MIEVVPGLKPPRGWSEIKAFYGWKNDYLLTSGLPDLRWQAKLVTVPLPAPLRLSFLPTKVVNKYTIHREIALVFQAAFGEVHSRGLWEFMGPFAGAYAWRTQRGSALKLSMHALGAASDHDPKNNPQGRAPKDCQMPAKAVEIMKSFGFTWGGEFKRPDCMHFQWGSGY